MITLTRYLKSRKIYMPKYGYVNASKIAALAASGVKFKIVNASTNKDETAFFISQAIASQAQQGRMASVDELSSVLAKTSEFYGVTGKQEILKLEAPNTFLATANQITLE